MMTQKLEAVTIGLTLHDYIIAKNLFPYLYGSTD